MTLTGAEMDNQRYALCAALIAATAARLEARHGLRSPCFTAVATDLDRRDRRPWAATTDEEAPG